MMNKPDNIKLNQTMVTELKNKIDNVDLDDDAKKIISGLIDSSLWLQAKLAKSEITIAQLKKIFGINSTEKKSLESQDMINLLMSQFQQMQQQKKK